MTEHNAIIYTCCLVGSCIGSWIGNSFFRYRTRKQVLNSSIANIRKVIDEANQGAQQWEQATKELIAKRKDKV